jgi:hypothetical protein
MFASNAPPVRPIATQITTGGFTFDQCTIGTRPLLVMCSPFASFFAATSQKQTTFFRFASVKSAKKFAPSLPAPQILNCDQLASTRRSNAAKRALRRSLRLDFQERLDVVKRYITRRSGTRISFPPPSQQLDASMLRLLSSLPFTSLHLLWVTRTRSALLVA